MPLESKSVGSGLDRLVLLLLFALVLLASPVVQWWATDHSPWLLPFGIWGLIILLGAVVQRRLDRRDH
ncbi:MAG: hypothetical protein KDH88_13980 [Chromatiales bacterium]|nr:hypothetical protein [Chromatiales bacterium]